MKRTFLVGMPGVGKTLLGKGVAKFLKCPWHDTDAHIEEKCGMPIKDIFRLKGEPYFRALEKQVTLSFLDMPDGHCVISTGGGSFCDNETRRNILASGFVIYLESTPHELAKRCLDGRPLLQCDEHHKKKSSALEDLQNLHKKREKYYKKAHARLYVHHQKPDELITKIVNIIETKNISSREHVRKEQLVS